MNYTQPKRITKYWLSCENFTIMLKLSDGKIIESAPIIRRFHGQPLMNLLNWVKNRMGPYTLEEMK